LRNGKTKLDICVNNKEVGLNIRVAFIKLKRRD